MRNNIRAAKKQLRRDVHSLETVAHESGAGYMKVSLGVVALANVKRAKVDGRQLSDLPTASAFLCEDDLESPASMEQWWNEHILQRLQALKIDSRTYLNLLAL